MFSLSEQRTKKAAMWCFAELKDPDLIAVALFCAIGLLVTINVILRSPDLGAIITQYSQF
jgi:hypothetical protein